MADIFTIAPEVSYRKVGNEMFILHRNSSKVFNLNKTAAFIWEYLQKGISLPEISEKLCATFNTDKETADNDIAEIIDAFIRDNLIFKNARYEH